MKMQESININGWTFELVEKESFYQCRGEIMYDYEHDEMPEPELWSAAKELATILKSEGYNNVEVDHSEKGWVEVYF